MDLALELDVILVTMVPEAIQGDADVAAYVIDNGVDKFNSERKQKRLQIGPGRGNALLGHRSENERRKGVSDMFVSPVIRDPYNTMMEIFTGKRLLSFSRSFSFSKRDI